MALNVPQSLTSGSSTIESLGFIVITVGLHTCGSRISVKVNYVEVYEQILKYLWLALTCLSVIARLQ